MTQIQYVKGQFHAYRALTKINFGKAGVDVYKDEIIEFDGTVVKIGGQDYVDPAVRGAINAGWFVPEADNISNYVAKKADIRLRPATNAGAKADLEIPVSELQDEEREVGSLESSKAKRLAAATPPQQRNPAAAPDPQAQIAALLKQVQELQAAVAKQNAAPATSAGTAFKTDDYSDISDDYSDPSGQDAVPVSRIKTSAVQTFKAEDSSLSKVAQVLQADGKPLNVERLKVNPVRTAKSVRLSADSATGDVRESREALDVEDLLPDAIKGKPKGKSGVVNTEGEDKHPTTVVFVKASDGTQIPWDKANHWKVRIKTALSKYGNDAETLKAIIAVEDAGVRKELSKAIGA